MVRAHGPQLLIRRELIDRLRRARIALIEAPGGYGKTTLADQLADALGCATVRLTFDADADDAELLAELRRGLRAVGLSDDVGLIDAGAGIDVVFDALGARAEPTLVLVDEVQRLDASAAATLAKAVRGVAPGMRVVLSGRRGPPALQRTTDAPDAVRLGIDDLRFTVEDATDLIAVRLGSDHTHLAEWLAGAVQGWPAATVLVLTSVQGDPSRAHAALGRGTSVIDDLLDDLVAELPAPLQDALPTLAALPIVDARLLAKLWGPTAHDDLLEAGLTIRPRGDGWSVMPDPVRDALAARGAVDPIAVGQAAVYLADRDQLAAAIQLLSDTADLSGVADLLASRTAAELEALGPSRLAATVDRLGDERIARVPELLLQAARAVETRNDTLRRQWLAHAEGLTRGTHPLLHRAVLAEQATDAVRFDEVQQALPLAAEVLKDAGPDEVLTRARALMARGVAQILSGDSSQRPLARPALQEAAELFHLAGDSRREAEALRRLGYSVELSEGDWPQAVEVLGRALALLWAPDRDRAILLTYYAEVLDLAGRREEAASALREAADIGRRLGDDRVVFFAAWTAALFAAHAGDRDEAHRQVANAERASAGVQQGDANLFEFLLTVADALSGLGDVDDARALVNRARPHAQEIDRSSAVRMVDARLEALAGDPLVAERLIDEIEGAPRAVPQQHWVRVLERAVARQRAGDVAGAGECAREAFALVAGQGLADLPYRIEPWMTHLLAPVLPAADRASQPVHLTLLGRFAVVDATGDRTPPPGQPRALLALVATRGRVSVDEAIDSLWPDVDLTTGRSRLRNLLNRIRERAGSIVERDGEHLVLADHLHVDAAVFERLADSALQAPVDERVGLARHALSHWAGEPLAEQRYETWAAGPRERLRRRHLSLLDLVIDATLADGQLDDAIRHLEAAIEAEPLDEGRHVQLIAALVRQGRRAVARTALEHALAVVASLDVDPGPDLAAWQAQLH